MKKLLLFGALAFGLNAFGQVPSYVPSNGLVGWWPFNGNANDESVNGNDGVVNGATLTTDRDGNANSAYQFNGTSNFIEVPHSNSFNFDSGQTISIWFYRTAYTNSVADQNHLLSKGAVTFNGMNIWASKTGNNINYHYIEGNYNTANNCNSGNSFSLNDWVNYTVVNDLSNVKIYLNGNLLSTCNIANPNTTLTGTELGPMNFGKGRGHFSGEGGFTGKLDDIGIWDRPLTACEITDLYNAQLYSASGISAGADQSVCAGNDVTLSGTGGSNYQWNNNVVDGTPFTPTATQDYIVIGEDGNGCLGTDTVNVEVLLNTTATQTETALDSYTWPVNNQTYTQSGTYTAVIPNTAGCDSTITLDLTMQFTGIGENEANYLAVYPNPTTSFLTIEGEGIQNKEYKLLDIQGRVVLNGTFKTNKETIDLKTLARGQYMLRVEEKEIKLVKE